MCVMPSADGMNWASGESRWDKCGVKPKHTMSDCVRTQTNSKLFINSACHKNIGLFPRHVGILAMWNSNAFHPKMGSPISLPGTPSWVGRIARWACRTCGRTCAAARSNPPAYCTARTENILFYLIIIITIIIIIFFQNLRPIYQQEPLHQNVYTLWNTTEWNQHQLLLCLP